MGHRGPPEILKQESGMICNGGDILALGVSCIFSGKEALWENRSRQWLVSCQDGTEINTLRAPKKEKYLWPGKTGEACLQDKTWVRFEKTEGLRRAKRKRREKWGICKEHGGTCMQIFVHLWVQAHGVCVGRTSVNRPESARFQKPTQNILITFKRV